VEGCVSDVKLENKAKNHASDRGGGVTYPQLGGETFKYCFSPILTPFSKRQEIKINLKSCNFRNFTFL
jgi:hypothetical protein